MDSSLLETLLVHWWKIILIIMTIALATIAIKITIKFDINEWLKRRREAKYEKERLKIAKKCHHGWTLYHSSPYSQCNLCLVFISTPILLTAREINAKPPPIILGQSDSIVPNPGKGDIFTQDYVGKRD